MVYMKIRSKVLIALLALAVVPLAILGTASLNSISSLGEDAKTSTGEIADTSENIALKTIEELEQRRLRIKAEDTARHAKAVMEGYDNDIYIEDLKTQSEIQQKLKEEVVGVIEPAEKVTVGYTTLVFNADGDPTVREIKEPYIGVHPVIPPREIDLEEFPSLEKIISEAIEDYEYTDVIYRWGDDDVKKYAAIQPFYFTTADGENRVFAIMATLPYDMYTEPLEELQEETAGIKESVEEDVDSAVSSYRRYTLIGLGVVIVIVVIVGVVFSNSLVSPIEKLTEAADKLSKGEMDVDVTVDSEDEIGELSQAFQRMKNSLQGMMERLKEE